MPQVSVTIILPSRNIDHEILSFEVTLDIPVCDLKGYIASEIGVPTEEQRLYYNNRHLSDDLRMLEEEGIKDGDMLALVEIPVPDEKKRESYMSQRDPVAIESTRRSFLKDESVMAQLRRYRPSLAEAVNDTERFREVWMEMVYQKDSMIDDNWDTKRLLEADQFDVAAQTKIEDMIRQAAIQKNLQDAYDNNPEVFGRVTMLYIPVHVNDVPVKAFVDSGAQTTIMSPSCAETCNIMRLVDKRYSGIAKGVGTAEILGRIHSADITIGNATMGCSFTVMEGKDVDLLLGLDMLKRFQAIIDLKTNKLVFGDNNEVSFLGEADIPKNFEDAQQAEPSVRGPGGTEIGAQSGTIKPAGTSAAAAESSSKRKSAFQGRGQTLRSASDSNATGGDKPSKPESSGSRYPKESIDQLEKLGFTHDEAIAALDACDGNVEYAAGLLFHN